MGLNLTNDEAAQLLRELDNIIEGDRFFLSPRIKTLRAIRAKIKPYPEQKPLPPPLPAGAAPRRSRRR